MFVKWCCFDILSSSCRHWIWRWNLSDELPLINESWWFNVPNVVCSKYFILRMYISFVLHAFDDLKCLYTIKPMIMETHSRIWCGWRILYCIAFNWRTLYPHHQYICTYICGFHTLLITFVLWCSVQTYRGNNAHIISAQHTWYLFTMSIQLNITYFLI